MESLVASLALLACPVAMGAMMWFMMRGMSQSTKKAGGTDELAALRAEQQRLEAEVGRLRESEGADTDGSVVAGR